MLSGHPEGAPPLTPNDPTLYSAPAHSHLICVLNILLQVLIAVVGIQTLPLLDCGSPPARATPTRPCLVSRQLLWFEAFNGSYMVSKCHFPFLFRSYNFNIFRDTSTFSEEDYFEGCQVKVPPTKPYNLNLIPGIHRVKVL